MCNEYDNITGIRSGEVLSLGIDKSSTSTVWSSKSELINEEDEDIPVIRKMQWMFPQAPGAEGCLFVLLGGLKIKFLYVLAALSSVLWFPLLVYM